jgi:hypothetical protein
MPIHVGSIVVIRARDQLFTGEVLAVTATHARCALEDGRTLWVANEVIQAAPAAMAAPAPSGPAPAPDPDLPQLAGVVPSAALVPPAASAARVPPVPGPAAVAWQSLFISEILAIYLGCVAAFVLLRGWFGLLLIIPIWLVPRLWAKPAPLRAKQWWKHGLIAYLCCVAVAMALAIGHGCHDKRVGAGDGPVAKASPSRRTS